MFLITIANCSNSYHFVIREIPLKALLKGTYVSFASQDIAEKLTGCVTGTILPFSFNPELELIADHALLQNNELFFNAARLDRSIALKTSDYVALAKPRLEQIAEHQGRSLILP